VSTVDINASAERVWGILSDVERWPEWTASMTRVELLDGHELAVGSRARIKQPGFPPLIWRVTQLQPGRSFSWIAKSAGMTTIGAHDLRQRDDAAVDVTVSIEQTGLFSRVVGLLFGGRTRRYLDIEANGLKRRSEQQ
jgi:uncharacterized membrane protein